MKRRTILIVILLCHALGAAAVWSYSFMAAQRDAAAQACEDMADVRRMAGQIEAARQRPTLAAEHERVSDEVTGLIEQAAVKAGVPAGSLIRITPEPPSRLGDTVYKEKPTQVVFRNISLKQLVGLVHRLIGSDQQLEAKSIRITAPNPQDTGDLWNAELVLTYLIYDPPKSPTGGGP